MIEVERIQDNVNGELPGGADYQYIIVENIENPERELNIFKESMKALVENKNLSPESSKWKKLLPQAIVAFVNQLEEDDYHNDDLASNIPNIVDSLTRLKTWEWYSSQLYEDGFEVVIKGQDIGGKSITLLHHQGLPHTSLFIGGEDYKYPTRGVRDVLSYKTWNPETLELK